MKKRGFLILAILVMGVFVIRSCFVGDLYSITSMPKGVDEIDKIVIENRTGYAEEYEEILSITKKEDIKKYMAELEKGKYVRALFDKKAWDHADEKDFAIKIYTSTGLYLLQLKKDSRVTIFYYWSSDEDSFYSSERYYTKGYNSLYNNLTVLRDKVKEPVD